MKVENYIRSFVLVFLFMLPASVLCAQTGALRGQVTDPS